MGTFKEIIGDLILMAKNGAFDVITHGVNCFCTHKSGIAVQFAKGFGTDRFKYEHDILKGNIDKLGRIDYETFRKLTIINSYTQYGYGRDKVHLDYEALTLCMRKINHIFKGKHIGLPKIGCGLAGGDWERVKLILQTELKDMDVTVVHYGK